MKLGKLIEQVRDIKPCAFSDETLTEWVNEVEGYVQTRVMLLDPVTCLIRYDWEENQDTELLVLPPHDKLYRSYLMAMIDFANGEYDRYENSMTLYNAQLTEYVKWFVERYHPADRSC